MYESFYGLKERPFTILPDPGFLYLGRVHSVAYAVLEYGISSPGGFTVITGEIGCGKTTLIRHLLNQLGPEVRVGLISNARDGSGELLRWVLLAFGLDYRAGDYVQLFERFQQFLVEEYAKGRRTILIIDESQNLAPPMLEELRMLSNVNSDKDHLLQLILSGQPQLRASLRRPELLQFSQRVSADYHINPLALVDSVRYLAHRVKVAGREQPLFTPDACALIHRVAGGVPRVINILADTALVYAYAEGAPIVSQQLVASVVDDRQSAGSVQLSHLSGVERDGESS
jgi:type II secretory pathway predicted ATPase ExeA